MKAFLFSILGWSISAWGFIPSVPDMLKEVTTGRKGGAVEIVLKHRIAVRGSGTIEIEERIFDEKNKTLFIWSGSPFPQPTAGSLEGMNYKIHDQTLPTKSLVLVRYLTANGPDELRDSLISERMIRRDHLNQFKPGFNPEGDPQTWQIKDNYLVHPEVYLKRLESGIAYAVSGTEEGPELRQVLFDRALKGIRRFEWREGETIQSWNCEGFSPVPAGGNYPRRIFFENNGSEVIQSDLLTVRALNARSLTEFKNSWRAADRAALTQNGEGILKLLMSYR